MSTSKLETASPLENAMQLMIKTYDKYSLKTGDRNSLRRADLKEMLTTEIDYLGNAQDKEAVDKVMGDLDSNKDKEVDFNEFIILVADLTVVRKNSSLKNNKKAEKK